MNENESLSLDWSKATTFPFFKLAFKVVGHKTAKQILGKLGTKGVIGKEVEEDYEVDYEYVDLQKDSDGDGLRDHINDPDDDNDGIPDLEDDDDDGDGVTDREDSDWFAHDEM